MLTQSTLNSGLLLWRGRLLAVLAPVGLALTGAAPAGAAYKYTHQKSQASSSGNVAAEWLVGS
jgi:hypothetical protein